MSLKKLEAKRDKITSEGCGYQRTSHEILFDGKTSLEAGLSFEEALDHELKARVEFCKKDDPNLKDQSDKPEYPDAMALFAIFNDIELLYA